MGNPYDILIKQDTHLTEWQDLSTHPDIAQLSGSIEGKNLVTVGASGAVSAGQAVYMNDSGFVSLAESIPSSIGADGTAPNFSSDNNYIGHEYDGSTNTIIIAGQNSSLGSDGYAAVGILSAGTIVFGEPVEYEDANFSYIADVTYDTTTEKVIISYTHGAAGGKSFVASVSGDTITFGDKTNYTSLFCVFVKTLYDTTNEKVIHLYVASGLKVRTGTVSASADTIAFNGSEIAVASTTLGSGHSMVIDKSNNKLVVSYSDSTNGYYGTVIVGDISGDDVTFGDPVVFTSAAAYMGDISYDPVNKKIIIPYASTTAYAIVGTVSGDTIILGDPVVIDSDSTEDINSTYITSTGKILFTYGNNNVKGALREAIVSGDTIVVGDETIYFSADSYTNLCLYVDVNDEVYITNTNSAGSIYSRIYSQESSTLTSDNFLGIAQEYMPDSTGVVLQLQSDTEDGDLVIIDTSPYNHPITIVGTPSHIYDAAAPFGNTVINFPTAGSVDTISVPSTVMDFKALDFTIETFMTGTDSNSWFFGVSHLEATGWSMRVSSDEFYVRLYTDLGLKSLVTTGDLWNSLGYGNFYHVAIVRDGNTFRLYVEGIQRSTADATGATMLDASTPWYFGNLSFKMDDFRAIKGVCKYPDGTTFVPHTTAFPTYLKPVGILGYKDTNQSGLIVPSKYYLDADGTLQTYGGTEIGKASSSTDLIITR